MTVRIGGSQCTICKHFRTPILTDSPVGTCAAFPKRIAAKILNDRFDHRNAYPGDHGVRWEPDEPGDRHPVEVLAEILDG
ncbi:hypothetical protein [Acrocarpospora catenulata]|uniref:hypothetical protein n=1 Tax=Acrocarpospora catenulata TaxID=2836182 RepID=UPI001BDAEAF9|nr:hypothetical protein [Acrocarpospora catenulata]